MGTTNVFDTSGELHSNDIALTMLKHLGRVFKNNDSPKITFNESTSKVTFEQKTKYAIASYANNSVLHILGFGKQTTKLVSPGKPTVEYIVLEENGAVTSELSPQLKRLTSIVCLFGHRRALPGR